MPVSTTYLPYTLHFTFDAGTSRGVLREKTSWIVKLHDLESNRVGWGEAGPLEGLSVDFEADFLSIFNEVKSQLSSVDIPENEEEALTLAANVVPESAPSVRFAIEMALLDLITNETGQLWENNEFFSGGGIPINGLIWMGDESFMRDQFKEKLSKKFDCFKMKIGAIDFQTELATLEFIRENTDSILRVDANGAFSPEESLKKLHALSRFSLHSIEQPIESGQYNEMARLCRESPIPIALDEELIGINDSDDRRNLLATIAPQYIILKPTLLGGIRVTRDWVSIAEELNIGWWITSALESNIGLNAICQLTSSLNYSGHQGLGTGQLYSNNFTSPLEISDGYIYYRENRSWDYPKLS